MKTISLKEWNNATTEQRAEWLKNKVALRPSDLMKLQAKVASYRSAKNLS